MGTSIDFIPINFSNNFAFKMEKFHLSPEKRARTAKLSVPINRLREKNYVEICSSDMGENFFGEAVRHSSKLFKVKKTR